VQLGCQYGDLNQPAPVYSWGERILQGFTMKQRVTVIQSDPAIMGGTPVFVGTRVPLQTLLDYLEGGQPLSEFLEDFPTVTREQAIAALEQAKEALLALARPA
jgi:uncharacterized protein (DUF433 family)